MSMLRPYYLLWKSGHYYLKINAIRQCSRSMATIKQSPSEYCLNLVRKHDHESFLCTLLLPNEIRSVAIAIRAFNVEVATVEDQVRDTRNGLLRLKFWEDAINGVYEDSPPKTPTALELHRTLKKCKLSKRYFKRLIEARYSKLESPTFPNLASIENYAENAFSSIYYLLLEAKNTKDLNTDHFASHFGKASGIVTLIRAIPYYAQKSEITLPQELIAKHKVSLRSVFRGQISKEFKDALFELSSCANSHLQKARLLKDKVEKTNNVVFLPYLITESYLEKLRRVDFDVFDPKLQKKDNLLPLRLYWRKVLNKLC
ncbi:NADH dehydrogenase (ubiquinone) complex I, assembly factor 6 [Belonocnema kinseyi]|uniref:NADH dehydrogenase (ubiquinone) complex I, assembly factor 6 n=1 Tax=Belonocnema kinseyi TaxID=2817044 RepID=UPI00143D45C5|nr:NADH dehydrogenase (ubiquinone) complex I, assembly factor 6 [Belonocnema kinseyi]XP_033216763.1 NADH dehydrogenase (ubiquinone) complex I, assembly factor 6 [Belonocnema kinseyi]